jgi:hypothetical protein
LFHAAAADTTTFVLVTTGSAFANCDFHSAILQDRLALLRIDCHWQIQRAEELILLYSE